MTAALLSGQLGGAALDVFEARFTVQSRQPRVSLLTSVDGTGGATPGRFGVVVLWRPAASYCSQRGSHGELFPVMLRTILLVHCSMCDGSSVMAVNLLTFKDRAIDHSSSSFIMRAASACVPKCTICLSVRTPHAILNAQDLLLVLTFHQPLLTQTRMGCVDGQL